MDQNNNNNSNNNDPNNNAKNLNGSSDSTMETKLDDLDQFIQQNAFVDELPKSLIITNMDFRIFNPASEQRIQFEKAFKDLDSECKFFYFKSFKRARIDFTTNQIATKARIVMDQMKFGDETINCYFAEVADDRTRNELLKPPALEKQFLISPPASPPEGWEPCEEAQPVLNISLQSALANLIPGSTHELHPPSVDQPGIVVHICGGATTNDETSTSAPTLQLDNDDDDYPIVKNRPLKIAQTPCPPTMRKQADL